MKLTRNVLLAASLIANQSVFAAAFQLRESNTEALGHAVAGSAALKNSIAAMSNNPATMTSLPSHEVGINSAFVGTKNKFTQISASNTFTAGPARFDVTGTPGEDGGGNFVIPAAYLHMKVNPELSVGLNYTVPFGLTTKYDEYWIGRFFAIESKIATHDFNLAVAYKVHPMVSLGGGVSTQYADAKLSKAIDNRIINAALKDGYAKVSGDDLSYGFNLGAVFEPSDMVRLGIIALL